MNLKLKGKTAIVTGGSKGIGAGICSVLAAEGCNLVINYRSNQKDAEEYADEIADKEHVHTTAIRADVSKETEAEALYRQAIDRFGRIDILINNASGGFVPNQFQDISAEEWKKGGEGILNPVFYMSREFLKHCLSARKGGHIVNILSKSAILSGSVNNLLYVANKGALVSLTRGMAKEFLPYGIYVNGIIPGYVRTERVHIEGDERTERVKRLLPTGKFAAPEEIGYVAAILCSPLFRQMIGSLIDCTGGTLI